MASWEAFKDRITKRYLDFTLEHRKSFIFRGHASSEWRLQPTLDRLEAVSFASDSDREGFLGSLIDEFRRNIYGLSSSTELPSTDANEWEFLGRHHGLPTTILDWTESPYVAAYFALEAVNDAEYASVWVLNRAQVAWDKIESIEMDSFEGTIRFNIRSAEQRGVSMRVSSARVSVEEALGVALLRIDIPRADRYRALIDLDEMLINHRTLYRDLHAAARVAALRNGAE